MGKVRAILKRCCKDPADRSFLTPTSAPPPHTISSPFRRSTPKSHHKMANPPAAAPRTRAAGGGSAARPTAVRPARWGPLPATVLLPAAGTAVLGPRPRPEAEGEPSALRASRGVQAGACILGPLPGSAPLPAPRLLVCSTPV